MGAASPGRGPGQDQERRRRVSSESPSPQPNRSESGGTNLQNVFSAISWALLVAVMFGGYFLLRLLSGGDGLSDHEEQFFRAGHGHAGVLATVGILYGNALGRTVLSASRQIAAWLVYLFGVGLMSGGLFVHMAAGEPGEGSIGTTITIIGGVVLAVAVLFLAWHLFRARNAQPTGTANQAYQEGNVT